MIINQLIILLHYFKHILADTTDQTAPVIQQCFIFSIHDCINIRDFRDVSFISWSFSCLLHILNSLSYVSIRFLNR